MFDSRHDLFELSKAARFGEVVRREQMDAVQSALIDVAKIWSSNHRYRSDAAMRAFLRRRQLNRGVNGDFLKYNARCVIDAACVLVKIGLLQWKN